MIAFKSPHRSTRLLGLLCLVLCAAVAAELAGERRTPAITAAVGARPPAAPARNDHPDFALPPAATYAEIEARPLFSDTRRPAAAANAAAEQKPQFMLVGTIVSKEGRRALIKHGQPGRVDHVAEGQALDGWTVRSILPDRVIFTHAKARLEVKEKAGGPAAAPRARRE